MHKYTKLISYCLTLLFAILTAQTVRGDNQSEALRSEIDALRMQIEAQRASFEAHIQRLEAKLKEMEVDSGEPSSDTPAGAMDLNAALARERTFAATSVYGAADQGRPLPGIIQRFNPEVSVVVDGFYHYDNSGEGIPHVLEEIAGFAQSHDNGHGHDHAEIEDGFNLREVELHLSAAVDPYFKSWVTFGFSEDSAETEEAVIQTTGLPWGLQLKGGKFLSDFSRINAQHPHEWDFVDAPLAHYLLFGDEGVNETGLQLSWLAPTRFQLLFGVEALQGENDLVSQYHGDGPLSERSGPRLWVGWAKIGPNLPERHGLQLGLSAGRGVHQEEHDALDNAEWFDNALVVRDPDGEHDEWLDGHTTFAGADIVYKYDGYREHGAGNWTLQGGYLWRRKELELVDHILPTAAIGNDRVETQDGYYAQAVHGFLPRWRAGLRWEQIGLANRIKSPGGSRTSFADSNKVTGMLDFTPSEFSRIRLQVSRGDYELDDGREDVWQFFVQWIISLGAHGAHSF